ncbi:MAG: magnesium-translocating P-type ATPase [Clostridiales bacterium]|nr:magnesium-translocating P-type ATPase [Clostridiales bacterium]
MKKMMNKAFLAAQAVRRDEVQNRLLSAASCEAEKAYDLLHTVPEGLSAAGVEEARETYGENRMPHGEKETLAKRLSKAFINPFTVVLILLAAVSLCTDVFWAAPGEKNPITACIITVMVLLSGILRFVQETRSGAAAAKLSEMVKTTACVRRQETGEREIPFREIVVGDMVRLSAGDMLPADVRILSAKDLFVSQSALTGESEPVEKTAAPQKSATTDTACLAFMGSTVVSGSALAVVVAVGSDTLLGQAAGQLTEKPSETTFEKGVGSVSWVLIRFMLVMVPVVLVLNGLTKGNWLSAALFAISIAVGLTPEMLPMIVTTCLAQGAVALSRERVIVKDLHAIQNLGSMDILCTDKTGTLTQDKVVLEYHLDIHGKEDKRVLRHAFLNSFYQTGLKNLMDLAIIDHTLSSDDPVLLGLSGTYHKVDEIPFTFERRRMSVVVADEGGKTQMITKGAIEEMLRISAFVEYDGTVTALTDEMKAIVLREVNRLNDGGMRVLGVAQKTNPSPVGAFSAADEDDMVLIGYLAFLDPPKDTAAAAIKSLQERGVAVKVLTGDNERVTESICRQVGLSVGHILLGGELENMTDEELGRAAGKTTVFAKLSPGQKARVVTALRAGGHCVGFMGDGINDAAAMKKSDVGISVDTAVDVAKESAHVILLEKDLMVLEKGVIQGRKTYANLIKYIKMTASSNFGNMLSVLAASAFLPFLPMAALHLILLNLIYDLSCTALPWDNVDAEFLTRPRQWDASSISRFMVWMGPVSSLFDITTYLVLYFVICPAVCGGVYHTLADTTEFVALFQAGWFIESMWTQSLVLHMLRTPRLPLLQSRAALPVNLLTGAGIAVITVIPFTPLGTAIGLAPLPGSYFAFLALVVMGYMALVTAAKKRYIRRYGELL